MSDDIYEHVTYDGLKFFTMAQVPELKSRVVTMNGVSKSYAMKELDMQGDIIKAIAKFNLNLQQILYSQAAVMENKILSQ